MVFKRLLINFVIALFIFGGIASAVQVETRPSPNYLIILVHGVNGTGWGFRGKGENGSDVSKIPEDKRGIHYRLLAYGCEEERH